MMGITKPPLSTDTASQHQRILAYLRTFGRMTTTEARKILDVLMPAARIFELRAAGYDIATLAAKLARFAEDYREDVRRARPELPASLNDRAQDNWEPLLATGHAA